MIEDKFFEYEIPNSISIGLGKSNMPMIIMSHKSGSSAEVYTHGAHIASWKNNSGREMLFMSEHSEFGPRCAIRGGIPVIFPQFGDGPLPKHGFARNLPWTISDSTLGGNGDVFVSLLLTDTDETRELWDHEFHLVIDIKLSADKLSVHKKIRNAGVKQFAFQSALHTYFRISEINDIAVFGLENIKYIDTLTESREIKEDNAEIRFKEETDRIYVRTPDILNIDDIGNDSRVRIEKRNMPDVVVWNPWIAKSGRLPDFGDDEYTRMVCVETGSVASLIELFPGDEWIGDTEFSSMLLDR